MNKLVSITKSLAALFVLATFAPALLAAPVISNVNVPLSGTVFVPLSNGSLDSVALTGTVQIQTEYDPHPTIPNPSQTPMVIYSKPGFVHGKGATSGQDYYANDDTNKVNSPILPSTTMKVSFNLETPVSPTPPAIVPRVTPFDVTFRLTFNPATGALLNVAIESMSVPVP